MYFVLVMDEAISILYCASYCDSKIIVIVSIFYCQVKGIVSHFMSCNKSLKCVVILVNPPPLSILVKFLKGCNVMIMKENYIALMFLNFYHAFEFMKGMNLESLWTLHMKWRFSPLVILLFHSFWIEDVNFISNLNHV